MSKYLGKKTLGFVIAALLIGIIIGYGVSSLLAPPSTSTAGTMLTGVIPIGVAKALTGSIGPTGLQMRESLLMSADDVNAWLNATGQHFSLNLRDYVEDTASDPSISLEKVQALAAKGVHIIFGPDGTANVRNCQGYIDSNHILTFATWSTGALPRVPSQNYIFRLAPTNVYQAKAASYLFASYGIKDMIAVGNHIADNSEMLGYMNTFYVGQLGGHIDGPVWYEFTATDFSAPASALNDLAVAAIKQYGAGNVAIYAMSFGEITGLLQAASTYPTLMSLLWVSTDAVAQMTPVITQAGKIAAHVVLPSTIFGSTESSYYWNITSRLQARLHAFPSAYAVADYDAVWLLAHLMVDTQSADPVVLKPNVIPEAQHMFGASGWMALNADGDRAQADFDIFAVVVNATTSQPAWEKVAAFSSATQSIVWFVNPRPEPGAV
jgi:branched-chain amino acid transport system substrate-binding protein